MTEYQYKVSVVMAVYNVEPYIHEAIDSVIAQDIGFENIQLILVDDGSTDTSGAICDEYVQKHPDNVMVIHKENGGVSSSRNSGLKKATGKYVSFFDPDDILDENVFSKVCEFFENHNEVDVVSIPIMMFGTSTGEHPLNTKFKAGTRVIDLQKEWWLPQLSLASAFLRTNVAQKNAFDEDLNMPAGEDAHELIRILPLTGKLGVVSDAFYHYRRRGDSLIGTSQQKESWYTQNLQKLHIFAIEYCNTQFGFLPKFVQYTLMYDIQWRLLQSNPMCEESSVEEYQKKLFGLFSYFDDDVILAQRSILTEHKSFALKQKYSTLPRTVAWSRDVLYMYGDARVAFCASTLGIHIQFAEIERDRIILEGWYPHYLMLDVDIPQLAVRKNDVQYLCTILPLEQTGSSAGVDVYRRISFKVSIPLQQNETAVLSLERCTEYGPVKLSNLILSVFFPVSERYNNSYYAHSGWVMQFNNNKIIIKPKTSCLFSYELRFIKEIWRKNCKGGRRAVCVRILYHVLKHLKRKRIWLIADKADRADDNGEAFFKYCCANGDNNIVPIFLIGKESPDYYRLKKIGTVVPYMSWLHKFLYLLSDHVISAYSHSELSNPFFDYSEPYRDLMQNCSFVFLQHGVIHTDVSAVLNRMNKNYQGFVTSAIPERNSICDLYGYTQNQVWLSGLPRHDYLYHAEEKSIVIMPTWRRKLFGLYHAENGRYDLRAGFEKSDYHQFFHKLFSNERLKRAMQKYGYTIEFVPHPVFFPYIDCFSVPDDVKLYRSEVTYREVFSKNSLLVTDYSSVAFDFSYLRKPVIYSQFSPLGHYEKGYFDYERDGFGEVEYTLEGTVDRIIEYMENDCRLKDKYRQRIDNFFAFNDRNNCQRVYEKIVEMDRRNAND